MLSGSVGLAGMVALGASASLQGGLSRDGREGEAYPLQPYYFLALLRWQYGLLEEEQEEEQEEQEPAQAA